MSKYHHSGCRSRPAGLSSQSTDREANPVSANGHNLGFLLQKIKLAAAHQHRERDGFADTGSLHLKGWPMEGLLKVTDRDSTPAVAPTLT